MDQMIAVALGEANRGKEPKVFDWDKAAQILKGYGSVTAWAGLREDWDWTCGEIMDDGRPVGAGYAYLSSTWATPIIEIQDGEVATRIECWKMQGEVPQWDAKTIWPDSAKNILKGEQA